jgi:diguanylate cyclase (GGDEF)-like protein
MSPAVHKLLLRQIRKSTGADGKVDWSSLLLSVDQSYRSNDQNAKRVDRANKLMAEELEDMLAIREKAAHDRAARIEEMELAQTAISASEARARHLAFHDTLTGLPNRALLNERLAKAYDDLRRNGTRFAVHCIDLDNFKVVNDSFGHQAGDALIRQVANILSRTCQKSDTIARLGGDEFAIVQLNATLESAGVLAAKIVRLLSEPIDLDLGCAYTGCSIGISVVEDASEEPLEALRRADLALYRAKGEGRGRYAFFEDEMDVAIRMKHGIRDELRSAITNGEIELAYQPQFNGAGGVSGVEALARWTHAERGVVPPSLFIPVAEEGGLIVELGYYVLRRAFLDAKRWPDLKVAVNVSAPQIRMKDFVPRMRGLLRETGASPHQFELEITEGLLMGDDPVTIETLRQLRQLGFGMALDDFGTGYSSLSYLRRYPIDKIKIDRSFIKNLGVDADAEPVVFAIVALARSLGLDVIAEGVETTEQRSSLETAGCGDIQGFLVGRPMWADEFDTFLGQDNQLRTSVG